MFTLYNYNLVKRIGSSLISLVKGSCITFSFCIFLLGAPYDVCKFKFSYWFMNGANAVGVENTSSLCICLILISWVFIWIYLLIRRWINLSIDSNTQLEIFLQDELISLSIYFSIPIYQEWWWFDTIHFLNFTSVFIVCHTDY